MGTRCGWLWLWVVLGAILIPCGGAAQGKGPPKVTARAALVMDGGDGAILWARNPDLRLSPASTTKVMTAILALESDRLDRSLTASRRACRTVPSKVNLRPGQRFPLQDLVYAILLNSANDASVAIAEGLGGSVSAFAARMTARARQLGAKNTRFANPHGLTEESHYSTARDLATIFRHAMSLPKFRAIAATKATTISEENGTRKVTLRSHNRLLDGYRIPVVGKTGYTKAAKKCFVGAGLHGGREIIVAVLGSTDLWGDTKRLLEFGFGDSMPPQPLLQKAKRTPSRKRVESRGGAGATKRAQRYAIQVGTFDRIDQARRLQHGLGKRGYEAQINRVGAGKGKNRRTRYQVRVGSYPDRRRAQSAVRTITAQVALPTLIVER